MVRRSAVSERPWNTPGSGRGREGRRAVVIVEKREGAGYVPVKAFYKVDGVVESRGRVWLARTTAAVAAGTVPWHRAFVTRTPA